MATNQLILTQMYVKSNVKLFGLSRIIRICEDYC